MPTTSEPLDNGARLLALEQENERLRERLIQEERRARVLREELQHRVRNVLSVINAVARRTAETSETAEDYALHLDGRIGAIARAQSFALRDPEGRVELSQLIAEELLAHAALEGETISLSGPRIILSGRAIGVIWLAFHELAVNSVKFGALSAPDGQITVTWRLDQNGLGNTLQIDWHEQGCSRVPAGGRGFGTEVIERTLGYELGAAGSLSIGSGRVHCNLRVPLSDGLVTAEG